MSSASKPIYYLQAVISFTKGKQKHKREEWIVTKCETPSEIMTSDTKTMDSLRDRVYGSNYKGEKKIVIVKINERKIVGYESRQQ